MSVKKVRREHLDKMPCQRSRKRPAQQNEENIEKDLPEGAHA
jgi:hypothetical protein